MSDSHTPSSGARFVLLREDSSPDQAKYRVTLYLPQDEYVSSAVVSTKTGSVEVTLTPFNSTPPDWTSRHLQSLLKQTASAKRASGTDQWPRRVMRWRSQNPA